MKFPGDKAGKETIDIKLLYTYIISMKVTLSSVTLSLCK